MIMHLGYSHFIGWSRDFVNLGHVVGTFHVILNAVKNLAFVRILRYAQDDKPPRATSHPG